MTDKILFIGSRKVLEKEPSRDEDSRTKVKEPTSFATGVNTISNEGIQFSRYLEMLKEKQRYHDYFKDEVESVMSSISSPAVKNFLVNGQVQSGKTQFIIGLITKAIDEKYDFIVFLGGTNNKLLSQSYERLREDITSYKGNKICSVPELKETSYDFIKDKTIIVDALKEKKNLDDLLWYLREIKYHDKKVLIIDDEADYASTNNGGDNEDSIVYALIKNIRDYSSEGKYVAVTATPFANILGEYQLYPDAMMNLRINSEYTGNSVFISSKSYVPFKKTLKNKEIENNTLEFMIMNFLGEIVNRSARGIKKSQLLINTSRENIDHEKTNAAIKKIIEDGIGWRINDDVLETYGIENKTSYDKTTFVKKMRGAFAKLTMPALSQIVILNKNNRAEINKKDIEIIVGGVVLSRGVTFENLSIELLMNVPDGDISMDTLLQEARWFGYRKNAIGTIKIYMPEDAIKMFNDYEEIVRLMNCNKVTGQVIPRGEILALKDELKVYEANNHIVLTRKE